MAQDRLGSPRLVRLGQLPVWSFRKSRYICSMGIIVASWLFFPLRLGTTYHKKLFLLSAIMTFLVRQCVSVHVRLLHEIVVAVAEP